MSATGRGGARIDKDHYPTPEWCVDLILNELNTDKEGLAWSEPCRAEGVIYNKLPSPKVWAEIRQGVDYLTTPLPADVTVTNPPYELAEQFLRKNLQEAKSVWYLLRLNFLGGQARKAFFDEYKPTHLFTLSKRPAYVAVCKTKGCKAKYPLDYKGHCEVCGGKVGPGTDATEYAWVGWDGIDLCKRPPGMYWL